jgi:hypothetical protein
MHAVQVLLLRRLPIRFQANIQQIYTYTHFYVSFCARPAINNWQFNRWRAQYHPMHPAHRYDNYCTEENCYAAQQTYRRLHESLPFRWADV